ncbi:MAG TPA: WD40 repeat domain-containing protein, partial [Planctomycetota bacterium]|nr:WD40 repeat domain-containing protein [Planctomycetota bacterium]
MKRVLLLLALVGCAAAEPVSSRMVPSRWLEFSSRRIGERPFEHDALVTAVAFTASGDRVVTGTATGEVCLFDLDGHLRRRERVFDDAVSKVAFLADGTRVALGASGELRVGVATVSTRAVAFATSGPLLAYSEGADSVALLLSGRAARRIEAPGVTSVSLACDAGLIATVGSEGIAVRDLATERVRLHVPPERIEAAIGRPSVELLPGEKLLVLDAFGYLSVLDMGCVRELESLNGGTLASGAALREANCGFAVAADGAIARSLWDRHGGPCLEIDRPDGGLVKIELVDSGEPTMLAFSPDARWLVVGRASHVDLMDAKTEASLLPSRAGRAWVAALGFTARGKRLVSVGLDGHVVEWSLESGAPTRSTDVENEVRGAVIAEPGTVLVIGRTSVVDAWTGATLDLEGACDGALSPGGSLLATVSTSGRLAINDLDSGTELRRWMVSSAQHVAFSADGRSVAVEGGGALHVFDVPSGASSTLAEGDVLAVGVGREGFVWVSGADMFRFVQPRGVALEGMPGRRPVLSPRADLVAFLGERVVRIHDARTGKWIA